MYYPIALGSMSRFYVGAAFIGKYWLSLWMDETESSARWWEVVAASVWGCILHRKMAIGVGWGQYTMKPAARDFADSERCSEVYFNLLLEKQNIYARINETSSNNGEKVSYVVSSYRKKLKWGSAKRKGSQVWVNC